MAKAAKKAVDDNSNVVSLRKNEPSDDAVIAVQIGKYQRGSEALATEMGRFRNTVKHVEAKGLNTKALKAALAIKKSGNVAEAMAEIADVFLYLRILGTPATKGQLDMFSTLDERTPVDEKARDNGLNAGRLGLATDANPYAIDSEAGQIWMSAWHDGLKERELVLSMEPVGDELIKGSDDEDNKVFNEDADADEDGEAEAE